ncbi:ABC transporter permease [Stackebrandtia nassauensis]|uniref:Binding-protein-dependent transport systems inner membrane component n=1 Tax=Stackebrandtia nassauensis (strain DSM 44728 / CIP 108903 / NRRL B-16338 / NBRC 102104 / LLR-40K-21) TaxID=446470 RepID=D3Q4P8_STANL|nr:ABC transporter permease subunit [Stackebrandtia nassauensis]ADD42078.1 binding-protein-dependent transport systems inner membrane component [Stackebrandtia nassauensis DSM 44728]
MSTDTATVTAPPETPARPKRSPWLLPGIAAVAVALVGLAVFGLSRMAHNDDSVVFTALTDARDWVDDNRNSSPIFLFFVNYIHLFVASLVDGVLFVLQSLGWPATIAIAVGLGAALGGWRLALVGALGFTALGVMDLWDESIETLGLTIAAVLLSMLLGVPLGIWMGRSPRLRTLLSPVLDAMQIMPTFTYLAPMALLFSIGNPSATIATLIYAIPVSIRIAALAIEQVPATVVEASESLGSTRWQTMVKVRLPLARRTLLLAVNQTIMMALSMVVITALIDADGLGQDVVRGLQQNNVGMSLEAGLAVVVLAIILDRFTRIHDRRTTRFTIPRVYVWGFAGACAVIGFVLTAVLPKDFPEALQVSMVNPVNHVVDVITTDWYGVTSAIKDAASYGILNPMQEFLVRVPFWTIIAIFVFLALRFAGWQSAVTAGVCLSAIVALGLWQKSMETLVTVLLGVVLTVIVGVALGVLSGRSDRFETALRPVLDAAQTMPAFVYLVPALALFGASRFTAIVAAIVYAAPPVVRLVSDGIRGVSPSVVEAARSCGSTSRQLLWKVQLPMSRRSLLLALNQGIVMVLAMVVIGGMVGAEGLGETVVTGFVQTEEFGAGFAAGLAIVLLGITLDRITQGAGRQRKESVR